MERAEKSISLGGYIEYQKGSVVSKQIINKAVGTVTLFAFDAGQSLSEHTVPYDALVLVVDGAARITIAGSESGVSAGEMIVMPAGQPHSVRAHERFKMLLVMIRG